MDNNIKVYGTLVNHTTDRTIAYADQIKDLEFDNGAFQNVINRRVKTINNDGNTTTISTPLSVSTITCSDLTTSDFAAGDTVIRGVAEFLGVTEFSENVTMLKDLTVNDITASNLTLDEDITAEQGFFHDVHGTIFTNNITAESSQWVDVSSDVYGTVIMSGTFIPNEGRTHFGTPLNAWPDIHGRYIYTNNITASRPDTLNDINICSCLIPLDTHGRLYIGSERNRWAGIYADTIIAGNVVSGNIDTLEQNMSTLLGDGQGSISQQISSAIAAVVDSAPAAFDTLKEIADWIAQAGQDAADLVNRVVALESKTAYITAPNRNDTSIAGDVHITATSGALASAGDLIVAGSIEAGGTITAQLITPLNSTSTIGTEYDMWPEGHFVDLYIDGRDGAIHSNDHDHCIGIDGDLYPTSNNASDNGAVANYWKNTYTDDVVFDVTEKYSLKDLVDSLGIHKVYLSATNSGSMGTVSLTGAKYCTRAFNYVCNVSVSGLTGTAQQITDNTALVLNNLTIHVYGHGNSNSYQFTFDSTNLTITVTDPVDEDIDIVVLNTATSTVPGM